MESEESRDELSQDEKADLKEICDGMAIACLDDIETDRDVLVELFRLKLGLNTIDKLSELEKTQRTIVVHEFTSPDEFLKRDVDSYQVCILDGRFDGTSTTGPDVVEDIVAANPDIIIIGRSGEQIYNNKFRRMPEVAAVISKNRDMYSAFPDFARTILNHQTPVDEFD